ncbi:helix-turn-helix transcriptional regulator [Streptomyces sp. I3(2020)]|nr:helix-turn-helix transcriptional regulator [Streptomyces sp. I3(2020)]
MIRLLEERFQGLYAPSAGTVYPRLAKLEAEGLVTHTTEGGRKVYSITDAGRAELADRSGELADLELEIRESVAELAAEIRADVSGAAGDLRREMRAAAGRARQPRGGSGSGSGGKDAPFGDFDLGDFSVFGDKEAWRAAKEEMRRAKQEWKEQARRAKDESRRSREEAQRARRQAKEAQDRAQEQVQRIARQVQEQMQGHFARGDWPSGLREGLGELVKEMGDFGKDLGFGRTGSAGGRNPVRRTRRPRGLPGRLRALLGPRERRGVHGRPGARPGAAAGPLPGRRPGRRAGPRGHRGAAARRPAASVGGRRPHRGAAAVAEALTPIPGRRYPGAGTLRGPQPALASPSP